MMSRRTLKWLAFGLALLLVAIISATVASTTTASRIQAEATADALSKAIEFVAEEVAYLAAEDEPTRRFYVALAAASYVQANLSSARFGAYYDRGEDLTSLTVGECLRDGVGICGNHMMAFEAILNALDVPVRRVQIYYVRPDGSRQGHAMNEVEWDDSWRLFDITWGFVPMGEDVLSFEELRAGVPYEPLHNALNPWTVFTKQAGIDFLEYRHLDVDVVYDGTGVIRPYATDGEFDLRYIPQYIGSAGGEISYLIDVPDDSTVTLRASGMSCEDRARLVAGDQSKPFADEITFEGLTGQVLLRVEAEDEGCRINLSGLTLS